MRRICDISHLSFMPIRPRCVLKNEICVQCGLKFNCCFVHRENGDIKFLTKGDNNAVDDRGLYKQGQHWLEKKDVVGRARG